MKRLQMQKDAAEGKGYGPPPKVVAKPYVSAYNKSGSIAGDDNCLNLTPFYSVCIFLPPC